MFTIRHRREAREPVADERVAALLDAAAAPAEPGPVPGEGAALAAFRAEHLGARSRRSPMLSSPGPLKTAAAAALGAGVLLTGGVAAAQTGSLPDPAQDVAQTMLAKVGVSVPGATEHAAGRSDRRGTSTEAPRGPDAAGSEAGAGADGTGEHAGKGAEISHLATSTGSTGVDKGAAISGAASGGKSQAGQHGKAEAPNPPSGGSAAGEHAKVTTPNTGGSDRPRQPAAGEGSAPVTTPNSGGTGTADGASGGHSTSGTGTAAAAGDGRSTAGSDNASTHRPDNRP